MAYAKFKKFLTSQTWFMYRKTVVTYTLIGEQTAFALDSGA